MSNMRIAYLNRADAMTLTASPVADSEMPVTFLQNDSRSYVFRSTGDFAKYGLFPGTAGNYFSTPDSVPISITGSFSVAIRVAPDVWGPGAPTTLMSKVGVAGNYSWFICLNNPSGTLYFSLSANGTDEVVSESIAVYGAAGGEYLWILATYNVSTGKVNFYLAPDSVAIPTAWTIMGAEHSNAVGSIFDSTATLNIGMNNTGTFPLDGVVKRALLYSGVVSATGTGGTIVADFNPSTWASGVTWTSATTGEVWTINGTASVVATTDYAEQEIRGTSATAYTIGYCRLDRHNLETNDQWRLQLYSDTGWATLLYDSGVVDAFVDNMFDDWDFGFSEMYFTAVASVKSFKLTLYSAANADGYIEAGRIFLGPYTSATHNMLEEATVGWQGNSDQQRLDGGSNSVNVKAKWRQLNGDMVVETEADRAAWMEIGRYTMNEETVCVSLYPEAGGTQERDHSIMGKFEKNPMQKIMTNRYDFSLTLNEN